MKLLPRVVAPFAPPNHASRERRPNSEGSIPYMKVTSPKGVRNPSQPFPSKLQPLDPRGGVGREPGVSGSIIDRLALSRAAERGEKLFLALAPVHVTSGETVTRLQQSRSLAPSILGGCWLFQNGGPLGGLPFQDMYKPFGNGHWILHPQALEARMILTELIIHTTEWMKSA